MTAKSILFLTPESDILKNITHFLLAKNMLPPPKICQVNLLQNSPRCGYYLLKKYKNAAQLRATLKLRPSDRIREHSLPNRLYKVGAI